MKVELEPCPDLIEIAARAIANTTDFDGDRMASRYADSELRDMAANAIAAIRPLIEAEAYEKAARWFEEDGQLCDCFARSDAECACGAWDDRKAYGPGTAAAAIRALKPEAALRQQEKQDGK